MNADWTRCTRCVISSGFPRIDFDEEGVCSFCRDRAYHIVDNDTIGQAKTQMTKMLSVRPDSGRYDALVCLSGGKDSTYTLMLAVRKYGLRVLAFTFDNGFLSEFAFDNIRTAVDVLAVDHLMLRPSLETTKTVFRASAMHRIYPARTLTRISAVCNSCITMVNTMAVTLALEKSIPFIVAGFTLGQIPTNAVLYKPNYRFIQESRGHVITALEEHCGKNISEYFSVREELLDMPSPWHINLLCFETASENEILAEVSRIGWQHPDDVDGCSSNCRLNAFNNHVHEMTYGYNPYELELSHLVRQGLLPRDQAMRKLDDKAEGQLDAVLAELGISHAELKFATAAMGATP